MNLYENLNRANQSLKHIPKVRPQMKRLFRFSLSLAMIAFLLAGCNDQGSNFLTDSQNSAPELAGEPSGNVFKYITKTGDEPEVVKYITPVLWDGASKLKDGLLYHFSSVEEMGKACSMDPVLSEYFKNFQKHFSAKRAGKSKLKASPELAATFYNFALVTVEYGLVGGISICTTTNGWYGELVHILNVSGTNMMVKEYYDREYHSDFIGHSEDCPWYRFYSDAFTWNYYTRGYEYDEDTCD